MGRGGGGGVQHFPRESHTIRRERNREIDQPSDSREKAEEEVEVGEEGER